MGGAGARILNPSPALILGALLLALALFYADSTATLFRLFPPPVLGMILFFGGVELAASVNEEGEG
jgi:xanthine/uracil permease